MFAGELDVFWTEEEGGIEAWQIDHARRGILNFRFALRGFPADSWRICGAKAEETKAAYTPSKGLFFVDVKDCSR